MEIVVHGRHSDVGQAFKDHCHTKIAKLERYDAQLQRADVELTKDQHADGSAMCVQLTLRCRGPVVRAEACNDNPYAAFEAALAKVEERLRRTRSRRQASHSHSHHADRSADRARALVGAGAPVGAAVGLPAEPAAPDEPDEPELVPGVVVREKLHDATPMSVEDALHQMELVGHDFFLFCDSASGAPSVVYRRRAYDYGLLRLGSPA